MKRSNYTFAELAMRLAGRRVKRVLRSPIVYEDGFGSCRAWAEFDDGFKLELALADLNALIEFPARWDADLPLEVFDEVDGVLLSQYQVTGILVTETTFSFGLILNDEEPFVLCLDTQAATRLELYCYHLNEMLEAGGKAFLAS